MRDRFQLPRHVGRRTPSLEGMTSVIIYLFVCVCCLGPAEPAGEPADEQGVLLPAAGGDVQPAVTGGGQLTAVPHQQEGLLRHPRDWQGDDAENHQVSPCQCPLV